MLLNSDYGSFKQLCDDDGMRRDVRCDRHRRLSKEYIVRSEATRVRVSLSHTTFGDKDGWI